MPRIQRQIVPGGTDDGAKHAEGERVRSRLPAFCDAPVWLHTLPLYRFSGCCSKGFSFFHPDFAVRHRFAVPAAVKSQAFRGLWAFRKICPLVQKHTKAWFRHRGASGLDGTYPRFASNLPRGSEFFCFLAHLPRNRKGRKALLRYRCQRQRHLLSLRGAPFPITDSSCHG